MDSELRWGERREGIERRGEVGWVVDNNSNCDCD
jgi:hypothetical protein